jgi:hypothetical protein
VPAHDHADRIDLFVQKFQKLGERVKYGRRHPIGSASKLRRKELEYQNNDSKWKKLRPGI